MDRKAPSLAKEGRAGSKKTALQGGYIPLPEEEGLGEKVEPSLAKEGRGDSKKSSFERRQVQSDNAMRNQI